MNIELIWRKAGALAIDSRTPAIAYLRRSRAGRGAISALHFRRVLVSPVRAKNAFAGCKGKFGVLTMKTGRSLTELAAELERQHAAKKDYIADTRRLSAAPVDGGIVLNGVNGGMTLKPTAHAQLASTLQIPKPYYDRMAEQAPDLLARNINVWLEKQPAKKLIRTMDNQVRAILSDSYRPLDNLDLAEAVLPKLFDMKATVESCEVTDSRLYLKAVTDRITGEIKKGDSVNAGIMVSNSEVGLGRMMVSALDFRLVCTNGMIREAVIKKAHLGRASKGQDSLEDAREFFRDETRQLDDRAFFAKVQDATSALFDPARFAARLLEYQGKAAAPLEADPVQVVELTAKRFGFTDGEKTSVLRRLIEGADLSQWGLANAVTRAAQDLESYDRSTEFEKYGGDIIELPANSWKSVS